LSYSRATILIKWTGATYEKNTRERDTNNNMDRTIFSDDKNYMKDKIQVNLTIVCYIIISVILNLIF
jgi:hypothetical protein